MKRFGYFLAVLMLALVFPHLAGAEDRALLVGVGQYKIEEVNLPGIDIDIEAMKKVAEMMGFKSSQITVLRDSEATLSSITNAIKGLQDGDKDRDRVLIYFSGHGSQIPDTDNDENDNSDEVLVPHDVDVDRENRTLVRAFLDDDFGRLLGQIKAKETLVLIDSCHSGTAVKGVKGITLVDMLKGTEQKYKFFYYPGMENFGVKGSFFAEEKDSGGQNWVSLSAARDDEKAIATREGSLFTRAILDAVNRAVSRGEQLTLRQLQRIASEFIEGAASSDRKPHHPFLYGNEELADVNLLRGGGGTPPPPSGNIWSELEALADSADYQINVSANSSQFKIGGTMEITCQAPRDGYLNIFNVDAYDKEATVLYPNSFHEENKIRANTTIRIPDPNDNFVLRVTRPAGKNLVVVFHTEKEINAFRDGYGSSKDLFRTLSDKSRFTFKNFMMRSVVPEKMPDKMRYGAGKVTMIVVE